MEFILKAYFNSFSLVRNTILNQTSNKIQSASKPLFIKRNQNVFKGRTSIVAFSSSSYQRTSSNSKNSLDEYFKFSYDKSTNELIGTSIKADTNTNETESSSDAYNKYRTHSIGLLSLNVEENDNQTSSGSTEDSSSIDSNITKVNNDNDEIIGTFTCELAHTAYFSISRLNSG